MSRPGASKTYLTSRRFNGYDLTMTSDIERFQRAQRDRVAELRAAVADKPRHAEFLEELLDAAPGTILEDLVPSRGVSSPVAAALVDDVEWTRQEAPSNGMRAAQYPNAYRALRIKTARATASRTATREHNELWAGLSFGGK